jgi:hypothetical protein
LLQGKAVDLAGILGIQHDLLAEQRKRGRAGACPRPRAQAKLAAGTSLTADELIRLAKEANMSETTTDTVAWRRYEQARPRTAIKLDPRRFERCTGFYRHPAGLIMIVSLDNDRFFLQLTGQPRVELFAENDSNFFLKVVPAQLTFTPSEDGNIDALILHQGGHDTVATRIDEAEARRLSDELGERVRNRMPDPRSEPTLARGSRTAAARQHAVRVVERGTGGTGTRAAADRQRGDRIKGRAAIARFPPVSARTASTSMRRSSPGAPCNAASVSAGTAGSHAVDATSLTRLKGKAGGR